MSSTAPAGVRSAWTAATVVLAVAALWLGVELVVAALTLPGEPLAELRARLFEVAPWHVLLFAAWALPIASFARRRALARSTLVWVTIAAGSATFLAARVAEGVARQKGAEAAAIAALASVLVVAASATAVGAAARVPGGRTADAATRAAQAGFVAAIVLLLDRAGAEMGVGLSGPRQWLAAVPLGELARLLGVALGVALLATRIPAGMRLAGAALVVAICATTPRSGAVPAPRPEAAEKPDVFLFVLDTLRADHVGMRDARGSLTPALDAIAAESIHFTNAFAPSNWTRGSMPVLLASIPFMAAGNRPPASLDLLAEHLQRAGFATVGVSANPLISDRLGFAQGFDRFVDPDTMGDFLVSHLLQLSGEVAPGLGYRVGAISNSSYFRAAAEVQRRAGRLLEGTPRPTFLYLQAMDPHGPYMPPHDVLPPEFRYEDVFSYYRFMQMRSKGVLASGAFRPRLENFRQRYAASVRNLDRELGRLIAELRSEGRWDEALVWVVSDHGEAFGERDWAGHTGNELGPALLRVPWLLKLPKSWGVPPRVEAAPVSTASLLPTTLGLLGLPPAAVAFGDDLAPFALGRAAAPTGTLFADGGPGTTHIWAAIRWPWKLVQITGADVPAALYDLSSDPAEERSIAEQHPELVASLAGELDDYRARIDRVRDAAASHRDVDAQTREMLRRLGYAE
jgi:arylsulfatase